MAFQLIKHIFNFFYPNETENQNDPDRPGLLLSFGDQSYDTVVWWCGSRFPSSLGSPPGDVEQGDLVDELWQDQAKRREICLREWIHSWDTPREEDLIQNFMSAEVSKDIGSRRMFLVLPVKSKNGLVACLWMFEDSEEAGPAGNQQWGLDAGQHHRRWNVYLGIPDEWVLQEIICGPLFSDNSDATSFESADELSKAVVPSLLAEECPKGPEREEKKIVHWLMNGVSVAASRIISAASQLRQAQQDCCKFAFLAEKKRAVNKDKKALQKLRKSFTIMGFKVLAACFG
ncbi:uncharacterized protein F5891DRAFT_1175311 [Suillus fuscotomentosus]|uniref:Uncharacterized protein n=1 Tax=Suillus fuscotomentosus TaxID=1912939 RepID=A0AAD4DY94_9AGAM|nr:uncharacterized protein F5891DRAFT_1175311 [Suillus fuscotomentosus]KAG1896305.1 hypothetical protein F5891DRAFT_1175311 [Suillus fuscotomentosus]